MRIALTGKPRVGKTTLVKRLVERFPDRFFGFYTQEVIQDGKRVGFEVRDLEGNGKVFAHIGITSAYRVGKYGIDLNAFESIALPSMSDVKPGRILLVDEVGKMELLSQKFLNKLHELLSKDELSMLLVIPIKDVHPTVGYIRRTFRTFLLTERNREEIFRAIQSALS